jgi:hypothetical protein
MKLMTAVSVALALASGGAALAQQTSAPAPAAREIPRPDQLEPGVNTTPDALSAPAPAAPPGAAPSAAPAKSSAASAPAAADATAAAAKGKNASAKAVPKKSGPDRLELDTTDITGNRELPKVLYIVPWKHSDLGDLAGRPPNSLLDEVLQPLDRDVFRRENRYYEDLKPEAAAAKPGAVQGSGNNP